VNQSLYVWVLGSGLSNSSWDMNVSIFEFLLFLIEDMGTNTVDDGVLVTNNMLELLLVSEVLKFNISLVSEISSWLDFFKLNVPNG